jgi:hypothetical protein
MSDRPSSAIVQTDKYVTKAGPTAADRIRFVVPFSVGNLELATFRVALASGIASLLVPVPALTALVEQSVAERFSQIAAVVAIYRTIHHGAITFWIYTSNETYDDELMRTLLAQEETILDRYQEATIRFRYIPFVLSPSPEELVGSHGVLIYQR